MTESDSHSAAVLELAEEFLARYRRGERPSLAEYIDRHPHLGAEIRDVFPAVAMLENIALTDGADGGPPSVETGDLLPFTQLGDFRLIREVGRGGMGVVYEAEQVSLGRHVALKVLPQQLRDAKRRSRFEREAKAAAKLHHTNIVPVFGVGEQDGQPYYVMQFIQGLGLDAVLDELNRMRRGPDRPPTSGEVQGSRLDVSAADVARSLMTGAFPAVPTVETTAGQPDAQRVFATTLEAPAGGPAAESASSGSPRRNDSFAVSSSSITLPSGTKATQKPSTGKQSYWHSVAHIGRQVADALDYAHNQGIQHRDIKPSNLLLDLRGTVWVTDFGLAKVADPDAEDLTHTGDVLGTLRYMPPEAFEGQADARGDVYSLGLTLYELVALRPAFAERDRKKLIKQVCTGEAPSLDKINREAPRDLVTIIHKAIDREPARRYASAEDLASDLQRFIDDEPILARRQSHVERYWRWARHHPGIAVLGGVLTAVLVLAAAASMVAAVYFRKQERLQSELAGRNQQLADDNQLARAQAEAALRQAETTLVDMQASRGLLAADRSDAGLAMLWFAKAAERAGSDPERQADNLLRARNWMREAVLPVAARTFLTAREVNFRPGGDLLLVLDGPRAFAWDWRADRPLPWCDGLKEVTAACWSPDGRLLALGRPDRLQVHRVPEGEVVHESRSPDGVSAIAFSRDGRLLAVAGRTVRLFEVPSGQFLKHRWEHPQPVHSLAFDPSGELLATACADKRARVFAVTGSEDRPDPLFAPIAHDPREPSPPAFIDGGRRLVTVSSGTGPAGGALACIDARTGKPVPPGVIPTGMTELSRVVASADGRWFAAGGNNGPKVWNADRPAADPLYLGHSNHAMDYAFSPDGTTLISASWDRTARLWSLPDGQALGAPLPHMGSLSGCAWSDDGAYVATAQYDGLVRVWRRPTPVIEGVLTAPWGARPRVSIDGRQVAPGRRHEGAYETEATAAGLVVLDAATGKAAGPPIPLKGRLMDSAVAADGRSVVAVTRQGDTGWWGVWDVATAVPRVPIRQLPGLPQSLAVRPHGSEVTVVLMDGTVHTFDAQTGDSRSQFRAEDWPSPKKPGGATITWPRAEYTPDGTALVLLTAGMFNAVEVRDAATGRLRFPPIRPVLEGGPCRAFALSADSRWLATAVNGKNAVQVWDLATGGAASQPLRHSGDFYGLFSVRFSPDGRLVATGHKDGQARVWDWKAGTLVGPPVQHADEVFDVVLTADGRHAVSVTRGRPGGIHVWELKTGKAVAPPQLTTFGGVGVESAHAVALALGGRIAFVGVGLDQGVVRLDLGELLAPPDLPPDALTLLGELASARRIEQGDVTGLTREEWQERWQRFRDEYRECSRALAAPPAATSPETVKALSALGLAAARSRHWPEALQLFDRARALAPDKLPVWYPYLLLCLQCEDRPRYRRGCAELLRRFGQTDVPTAANSAAWLCALGPDAVADPALLVKLSEFAAAKEPGWRHLNTLGAVLFRAGKHEQAVEQLQAAMKANPPGGMVMDWLFLAMANDRLGRADEARRWLRRADTFVGQMDRGWTPTAGGPGRPLSSLDRLEVSVLHREAKAQIEGIED
jgi:eukaryotic-like serine/threonine-protein kinase